MTDDGSDSPCIEYEDIISGEGRLLDDYDPRPRNKTGVAFASGDLLYGKLRPYLRNWIVARNSGVAVGDFWVLRHPTGDSRFLFVLVQSARFEAISAQSAGSKMPRADWQLVSRALLPMPNGTSEQQQIGLFFERLDQLIALHQRA